MPNRLADETSPYLRQHAHNPVDWRPWGDEALTLAREEDRPILLSVGYAACHWCHVMERESFDDEATAELMNRWFVPVKVDREERPDVDSVYMDAVQRMTGHGGWPMTVFLTPDGTPFFGGTYFPPEPRQGMPSFPQVLQAVADAWENRRDAVESSAAEIHHHLRQATRLRPPPGAPDAEVLERAYAGIAARFDPEHGGFGNAPKFPQPMVLEFLLRRWKRSGSADALVMVEHTLGRMAAGGLWDHLGGGFHRYSVDARWLVPHFEKMLYDNALLARVYVHAWQATGEAAHRRVAEETLGWMLREMRSPEGGFHATLDADSEGEEGLFYLWTPDDVDRVLGPEDGSLVRAFFGVTAAGHVEGRSVLHEAAPLSAAATELGVTEAHLAAVVDRAKRRLLRARATRERPGLDDKVVASWNAMAVRTLAEAALAFDSEEYREAAVRAADFLLTALRPEGRLKRTYGGGRARIDAFLEDHALLADALVSLYAADPDPRWVREARALADAMLERFWEEDEGAFFDAPADQTAGLPVRPRDLWDNATPSGGSSAVTALLRLAPLTGEPRYARVAAQALDGMGELLTRVPLGFGQMLCALDRHLAPPRELALVGDPADPATEALLRVAAEAFLPDLTLARAAPDDVEAAAEVVPLLEARTTVDGRPAAYVCERFACRTPVTEPDALAAELGIGRDVTEA